MTVFEMLDAILKRYAGADPESLASFKPVYYARFGKREGPHLQAAFDECCATFKPTARQPFPIPLDIEAHLPSLRHDGEGTPPIREKLERRSARAAVFLADWLAGQGGKIKAQRAPLLYAACFLEATDQARARALDDRVSGIVLDQPTINLCFQRAISTERVKRFGRMPGDMHKHWSQLVEIATEWKLDITPEWWSKDTAKSLAQKDREAA
jgi:hypothetical protein